MTDQVTEPPGRIDYTHPFLPPDDERDPVRRLRGRLAAPVTLWTAQLGDRAAGLTVSSVLVAEGEPSLLLGLVGEESDLLDALEQSGRFAVSILGWSQRAVADAFAGVRPAPGGPFRGHEWVDTAWGPVLASATTWAGCRMHTLRPLGYARLVEAALEYVVIGTGVDDGIDGRPVDEGGGVLVWRRGRYGRLPG
ncbi:MAG: flavin reductase family protein [Actinomycetota bacterium]|nr:flavin reductase family protein [Actinomycetota bacterium]